MTLNPITIVEQVLGEYRSYLSTEFQARDPQLMVDEAVGGQIMTDYKALCAELNACIQDLLDQGGAPSKRIIDATCQARSALAEPEMNDSAALNPRHTEMLQELSGILCAANSSLKALENVVDCYILDKGEGNYTYCDMEGDFYCLRKALKMYEELIRASGLNMDPVR